jgi:hypothetical protein
MTPSSIYDNKFKKYITINNSIVILFILLQLFLNRNYRGYISIVFVLIMLPIFLIKLMKQIKKDRVNNTDLAKKSIIQMLFILTLLIMSYFML